MTSNMFFVRWQTSFFTPAEHPQTNERENKCITKFTIELSKSICQICFNFIRLFVFLFSSLSSSSSTCLSLRFCSVARQSDGKILRLHAFYWKAKRFVLCWKSNLAIKCLKFHEQQLKYRIQYMLTSQFQRRGGKEMHLNQWKRKFNAFIGSLYRFIYDLYGRNAVAFRWKKATRKKGNFFT